LGYPRQSPVDRHRCRRRSLLAQDGPVTGRFDWLLGASRVAVKSIGNVSSPFEIEYDLGNPAADADGNVKMPNAST